jgi:hypothetical protein
MKMANKRETRRFGFVMGGALGALALIQYARTGEPNGWLAGTAVLFAGVAWLKPGALAPLEAAWLKLGAALGAVNSRLLLSLIFFLVVTPLALVLRWMRRVSIEPAPDPSKTSYWRARKAEEFSAKRMERQF